MRERKRLTTAAWVFALSLLGTAYVPSVPADPLRIGVTLHPYYSWVANIVGEETEVIPLIAATQDPHVYQPLPEDIERLAGLDALVVNGLGHDAFVEPMLRAAGEAAPPLIEPNAGVPLVASQGPASATGAVNSHTFLSITGAAHQIDNLAGALGRLDPSQAAAYRRNAREYKKRLRTLLGETLAELRGRPVDQLRLGTVHDGYAYLFQELGLRVDAVVQPRHGIHPSPRQVADSIRRIRAAGIDILFAEMDYEQGFVALVRAETGTRVARLSHLSRGAYTADHYERQMAGNLRRILDALRAALPAPQG